MCPPVAGDSSSFELVSRPIRQAFSLSAADYDQDGQLDLYVCVYYGKQDVVSELPLPLPYFDAKNGGGNYLIRNLGNWKFENVTGPAGLDNDNSRFSLAVAWEDYDNDGDVDLMVINDFGPNQLFQNDHGRFSDVAAQVGLLDGAFGMSATFADFDHNGRMDLYVSNMFSAAGNRVTFQPQFMTALPDADKARFSVLGSWQFVVHKSRGRPFRRCQRFARGDDGPVELGVAVWRHQQRRLGRLAGCQRLSNGRIGG